MISIVIGIINVCIFALVAFPVLPWEFLHLSEEIIFVAKGAIPLFLGLFGIFSILIGLVDITDKRNAKKEIKIQKEFEEAQKKTEKSN